ncbi:hypothetical protein PHLGIDRAFT_255875 [Phlebiopsis gigantea 11061_1 CR5-6]|uniref:Uncharacterized protein n=1 Tax=Phlebiopsis gigantea (strain 11061_1 CR5-6) TaxID=745531 RepID=A0A0C3NEM2_PHLG1|nr:hypothetical protein PHLGIDRAFT_255875 [Phlebiopsis gigantea 11061_1 CR5-6]
MALLDDLHTTSTSQISYGIIADGKLVGNCVAQCGILNMQAATIHGIVRASVNSRACQRNRNNFFGTTMPISCVQATSQRQST